MNWVKPPIGVEAVQSLATTYNLDLLTASILTRREFTSPGQIAFFLEEDERYLHNPFIFPDMEKAVERVLAAAKKNEKVLVCGDKDADGITATVLMVEALRMIGIEAEWRVPVGQEDYGLNPQVLAEKAAEGFTLVIAVDCGISEFSEISRCGKLGIDVLVFDHHMPREGELPDAYAIINPKIPGSYPFAGLCAAAIVSKFQWALALAGTDIWKEAYCLILAREEGENIVLEAILMRNLNEVSRIFASADGEEKDQFLRFISGYTLFTYGAGVQVPLITSFFGAADVHVIDIAPELAAIFPSIQGSTLEELEGGSRMARYFPGNEGKLTILRNLMITLQYRRVSAAFNSWRRGLDLVVLGTLADMMPLKDENRIMVRLGMSRLNHTDALKERRSALRELLIRQRLHEGRIGTIEAAWQLCPLINAAGRMGRADVGVELFLETDQSRISVLADLLVSLNRKRRTLSEEFWDKIRPAAYESMESLRRRMVIVADSEVPRGITGILASRLQKTMKATAVVISVQSANASGSIRCDSGMNAISWLESMGEIFEDFGGHPQAGGFRIPSARIENLKSRTLAWLDASAHNPAPSEDICIDAELSHKEIRRLGVKGLDLLLERLEPYGEGFRPLTFLTRGVKVHQAVLVGKPKNNHLKLLVSLGANRWPALWWDGADRYDSVIRKGAKVDLVYHVDRDRWRGVEARRLTILEASPCDM